MEELKLAVISKETFYEDLADLGRMLGYPEEEILDAIKRLKEGLTESLHG